ncbi:hypothetical protein D9V34_07425 [Mycetocola lacteus]|uniref:YcaO domain-containing protein n=2 Tax=Mycetocola lacteus TaxID=76637 RepID=A0A3L7ARC9_9MICO|nr:hypothetical protein D9V34_07425 [Mycetocola lacteus]
MTFSFEWADFDGGILIRSPAGRSYKLELDKAAFLQLLEHRDGELAKALGEAGCVVRPETPIELLRVSAAAFTSPQDLRIHADPLWSDAAQWLLDELVHGNQPSATKDEKRPVTHLELLGAYDEARLLLLDQKYAILEERWCPAYLMDGRAWVGPLITPGRTAKYSDLVDRRRAAVKGDAVAEAERNLNSFDLHQAGASELMWVAAQLGIRLTRSLADAPGGLGGAELEFDLRSLQIFQHPVIPTPASWPSDYSVEHVSSDVIDARTGIVLALDDVVHHPSVPQRLRTVQSRVSEYRAFSQFANNNTALGSHFDDLDAARGAAIGEAVERICGNYVQERATFIASVSELEQKEIDCLRPSDLELFSASQYGEAGFPFVPWEEDEEISWVNFIELGSQKTVAVPAFATYVNWFGDIAFASERPHQFMSYPGIAAGQDFASAVVSGIEEIVERDATMIWWLNNQTLPRLDLSEPLSSLWEGAPISLGQQASLISLPNRFGIPVIGGILKNSEEELLNIGFAARPTAEGAAKKAWAEALTLQDGSRDLLREDGLWYKDQREGPFPMENFKPWRADRQYLDDYRDDCRDVNDLMCQQQYHLDPRAHRDVAHLIDGPETMSLASIPSLVSRSLETYRHAIESRGFRVLVADLTTPDVAACGLTVVRVVIPGLVPNTPAAFPPFGNGRLLREPVELGLRTRPATLAELNYRPLPHA